MASGARRVFEKTMTRVDGLVALHPKIHGTPGRPRQAVSDLLRGALVLALAALDALVVDSVVEAVPRLARKGTLGPMVSKWAKDCSDRIVACFADEDPPAALARLCGEELGSQTFQRSAAIEGVLRDVLGCEGLWEDAASRLTAAGGRWEAPEVIEHLDKYVTRRNRIVHGGDAKAHGTATEPIRLDYVADAVVLVRAIGEAVTAVIDRRTRVRP